MIIYIILVSYISIQSTFTDQYTHVLDVVPYLIDIRGRQWILGFLKRKVLLKKQYVRSGVF
jgi:hypothetical protein